MTSRIGESSVLRPDGAFHRFPNLAIEWRSRTKREPNSVEPALDNGTHAGKV